MQRIVVAGIGFDSMTFSQALVRVEELLSGTDQNLLVTPNPEMLVVADTDTGFKDILNSAVLAVPDGIGIIWASYFLSLPRQDFFTLVGSLFKLLFRDPTVFTVLPERVTGTDLFPEILKLATSRREKVFLLGAALGVADTAMQRLRIKNEELKNLQVTTFSGSPRLKDEPEIIQKIQDSGATVLFVAYGAPAQEKWLVRNLPKLPKIKLAAGIGGAFDFHAGRIARAPSIFRSLGLEWLWRLIRQPRRVGRIWTATGKFIGLVWRNKSDQ